MDRHSRTSKSLILTVVQNVGAYQLHFLSGWLYGECYHLKFETAKNYSTGFTACSVTSLRAVWLHCMQCGASFSFRGFQHHSHHSRQHHSGPFENVFFMVHLRTCRSRLWTEQRTNGTKQNFLRFLENLAVHVSNQQTWPMNSLNMWYAKTARGSPFDSIVLDS